MIESINLDVPVRLRRSRSKGAHLPPGTVYVGRPSRWGNPHAEGDPDVGTGKDWRTVAVELFRSDLAAGRLAFSAVDVRRELAGRSLSCWCPTGYPCHGDVLLAVANAAPGDEG